MTPAAKNYTNDARSGKTNPDLIEIIEASDSRHEQNQPRSYNRAYRRAIGNYQRGRVCPPLRRWAAKLAK